MSNNPTSSTTEQRVAQTILQKPIKVKVGAKEYAVAPPSTATLILVSAAVSRLPRLSLDENEVVQCVLRNAKECEAIGEIIATLILGAKRVEDTVYTKRKCRCKIFFGLIHYTRNKNVRETAREQLSRELLENLSPSELQDTLAKILVTMQLGDFFGLTTFLNEINQTRPTKVVEPTALGQ